MAEGAEDFVDDEGNEVQPDWASVSPAISSPDSARRQFLWDLRLGDAYDFMQNVVSHASQAESYFEQRFFHPSTMPYSPLTGKSSCDVTTQPCSFPVHDWPGSKAGFRI